MKKLKWFPLALLAITLLSCKKEVCYTCENETLEVESFCMDENDANAQKQRLENLDYECR